MDKIYLNQLEFYGFHGVFLEETKLGQRFTVDIMLSANLHEAGKSDDLEKTVDYGEVFQLAKKIVEGRPYKLIEAVAEQIAQAILSKFALVHSCKIKISKPNPPISGIYHSVAVEISRNRNE